MVSAMNPKHVAKRLLFGGAYLQQSAEIGLFAPQQEVSVQLAGEDGLVDVTHANVICSLNPLCIGIHLPENTAVGKVHHLRIIDVGSNTLLALVDIAFDRVLPVGGHSLQLFRAGNSRRYFPSLLQQWAGSGWSRFRRAAAPPPPHASDVNSRERDAVFAFYMCPRPVVMVSSGSSHASNVFPMDLTGRIAPGFASFSLKSDKPVVDLIRTSRRLAVSSIAPECSPLAFACGKNHRSRTVDRTTLPFWTTRSPRLYLPVPEFALDVAEYLVQDVHVLGSHTLFITRELERTVVRRAAQLHLTMATYIAFRERHTPSKTAAATVSAKTV
jgi:flavin reductase (DIM6/NTAB) family NADH-FMN oxidoreductase RutF